MAVCATISAINVDVIIPTPMSFMLSDSVIQALSLFRFITTIGSCQTRPLPIMGLMVAFLEEEALKAATWLLNICQIYFS